MKKALSLFLVLLVLLLVSACSCDHEWLNATCTSCVTCTKCGETAGLPLGHSWLDATCTTPKVCAICEMTEGEAAGHSWLDATCQAPKTCGICQITEGTQTAHMYIDGKCSTCDYRQLGVGSWRTYCMLDEYLAVVDINFDTLVIYHSRCDRMDMFDSATLEYLIRLNCEVITYAEVDYIFTAGDGASINYEISGETIIISYEDGSSDSVILERIAPNQIRVISNTGSPYFTNKDWIFTYQPNRSTEEPPTEEPPATESPTTIPPSQDPTEMPSMPTAQIPSTEPPVTEPPTTEPPTTEPPTTEPSTTEPSTTEPPITEPPTTEPTVMDPVSDVLIISDNRTISDQTINTDVYITSTGEASFINVTVNGNIYCYGQLTCSSCVANNVYAYAYSSIMSCKAFDGIHGKVSGGIACNNITIKSDALDYAFNKWGKR